MQEEWAYVIKSKTKWLDIDIFDWWKYRDLIVLFVKRNFTASYKQTILGPAWALIQPLLTTLIFTVIFGNIAKLPTDGIPPFIFYFCGNVAWNYFSSSLTGTANVLIANSYIFGKVYFPRLTIPISVILTNLITFCIQFIFFICFWIYFILQPGSNIHPNLMIAFTPVLLLQMAFLGLGFGFIVSALTTKYRDLAMLITFGMQLWMYLTPVAYPVSLVSPKWQGLYMLNPLCPVLETIKYSFLGSGIVSVKYLCISWVVTLSVLGLGLLLFNKVEKTFMDTV